MIGREEFVPGFLAACPTLAAVWPGRLRPDDVQGDSPSDIDRVAVHLADCYARAEVDEFPAAFTFLERCLVEGSGEVRRGGFFLLFSMWLRLTAQPPQAEPIENVWLGPHSRAAWTLCKPFAQSMKEGLAPFLDRVRR